MKKSKKIKATFVVPKEAVDSMDIVVEEEVSVVPTYRKTEHGVVVDVGLEKGSYHFDLFPMSLGGEDRSIAWAHALNK